MYGEIKVNGIVLSAMPVGEYDRRVSMLTCEKGRISAFAQYSRRPKSTLRACTQPFVYGTFTIREGRESNTLVACDGPNFFDELKNDLESMYYGMYFCELMEYLTREGCDEKEQVKLLYVSLNALVKKRLPFSMVRRIFELRALSNFGEAPNVFECAACGKKETKKYWIFDRNRSCILCDECHARNKADFTESPDAAEKMTDGTGTVSLSEAARYAMHYCITCAPQKLYSFELKEDIGREFDRAVSIYADRRIDRRMKSLDVLETL